MTRENELQKTIDNLNELAGYLMEFSEEHYNDNVFLYAHGQAARPFDQSPFDVKVEGDLKACALGVAWLYGMGEVSDLQVLSWWHYQRKVFPVVLPESKYSRECFGTHGRTPTEAATSIREVVKQLEVMK